MKKPTLEFINFVVDGKMGSCICIIFDFVQKCDISVYDASFVID
jgi:hypothetical protein